MRAVTAVGAVMMAVALPGIAVAATVEEVDARLQAFAAKINAVQPGNADGKITSAVAGHLSVTLNMMASVPKPVETEEQGRAEARQAICNAPALRSVPEQYGITFHFVYSAPNWSAPLQVSVVSSDCDSGTPGLAAPSVDAIQPSPPSSLAVTSSGDGYCAGYLGRVVHPVQLGAVANRLDALPKVRSEFETNDEFKGRIATALGDRGGDQVVSVWVDKSGGNVAYDADRQVLSVHLWALVHGHTSWIKVLKPYLGQLEFSYADRSWSNIDTVVSQTARNGGSYVGTNAFGAKVMVRRQLLDTEAIFERKGNYVEDLFFENSGDVGVGGGPTVIAKMSADPATAKALKAGLKAAFVIRPKAPFVVRGPAWHEAPTFDSPVRISETLTGVIADIRCALIMDAGEKVIASIKTR